MAARLNLVLVYNDNMNFMDFMKIAEMAQAMAPEIRPFVVHSTGLPVDLHLKLAQHPTFVFAPRGIRSGVIPRGKIYSGRYIAKDEQMKQLKARGLPVPRSAMVTPGSRFTTAEWGPLVITKPVTRDASFSKGVAVRIPEDVTHVPPNPLERRSADPPRLMVQQFIDTGVYRPQNRVLTLFGKVLYGERISAEEPQPVPENLTPEALVSFVVTPVKVKRVRAFVHDADILDLAVRIHDVFPDVPLQACDILREESTGRLFVLEINAGGNTWHFSSKWGQFQFVEGKRRQDQFDAFRIAAEVLVERARKEAQ